MNDHLSVFSGALAPRKLPRHTIALHAAIASSSSTIRLSFAPSSPCRLRPTMSAVLWRPSITRDAVSVQFGKRGSNSHFQGQSLAFCQLNDSRSSCRAGGCRTLVASLKGKCSTVELRPQNGDRGCGFSMELLRHQLSFRGRAWNRTKTVQARAVYSRARSHAGLRARKRKNRRGGSQGGSSVVGYLLAWSTSLEPSLRTCGSRAAAGA